MRNMATANLVTSPPFETLFTIDPEVRDQILVDIRAQGFDPSKPIDAWDTGHEIVVIDGHTRLSVARELGVNVVPVSAVPYPNVAAALKHAVHNQRARRNVTGATLLQVIETVDRAIRQPKGGNNPNGSNQYAGEVETSCEVSTSPNLSALETASIVGTSRSMVERARRVYDDEEAKREVESGASISSASNGARARKRLPAGAVWSPDSDGNVGDEPWYQAQLAGLGVEVSLIAAMRKIDVEMRVLRAAGVSPALMMSDRRVSSAWNKALKQVNAIAAVIRGVMKDQDTAD